MTKKTTIRKEAGRWIARGAGSALCLMAGLAGSLLNAGEGQAGQKFRSGTGFFITAQNHLVTNDHVVDDCDELWMLRRHHRMRVRLLDTDSYHDLALLEAPVGPGQVAAVNPVDLDSILNETIYVSGYPGERSFSRVTITTGYLRDEGSTVMWDRSRSQELNEIITRTPILPGNSGGPVFDRKGRIIGVTKGHLSMLGNVGFAIPMEPLLDLLEDNDLTLPPAAQTLDADGFNDDLARQITVPIVCVVND